MHPTNAESIFIDLAHRFERTSQRPYASAGVAMDDLIKVSAIAARQHCECFQEDGKNVMAATSRLMSEPAEHSPESPRWWAAVWFQVIRMLSRHYPDSMPSEVLLGIWKKRLIDPIGPQFAHALQPEKWREYAEDSAMACKLLARLLHDGKVLSWRAEAARAGIPDGLQSILEIGPSPAQRSSERRSKLHESFWTDWPTDLDLTRVETDVGTGEIVTRTQTGTNPDSRNSPLTTPADGSGRTTSKQSESDIHTERSSMPSGNAGQDAGAAADCELLEGDLAILRTLERLRHCVLQVDIASEIHLHPQTVGKRMKKLRKQGLVSRPQGERGGEAITLEGIRLLQRHDHH